MRYELTSHWRFDAPIDAVWDAIFDAEAWPTWWRGVERVVTLDRGDAGGLGARQYSTWKSVLPYRLSFESTVTRVERLRLIEAQVAGELEGTGCWSFAQDDGSTRVRYEWRVRTTRTWMNLLAPVARPLFRWNHDVIMRAGAAGLARRLSEAPSFRFNPP